MAYARIKGNGIVITGTGVNLPDVATYVVDEKTAGIMGLDEEAIEALLHPDEGEPTISSQDVMPTTSRIVSAGSIAIYPPSGQVWMMGPSEKWLKYGGVSNISG